MGIRVTHVLRNGQILKDIKGHKVKKEDVPTVYQIIGSIERRINGEGSQKRN